MGVRKYKKRGREFWKIDTWLELADGSSKRFKKAGIPTREMATALEQKMRTEAFEGRYFDRPKAKPLTVAEAWKNYAPVAERDTQDPATDAGRAKHFIRHLGSRRAASLTLKDIDTYREKRKIEPSRRGKTPAVSSVNREVSLLRHVLNHAAKCGDLDRNPLLGVKMLNEDNVRDVAIGESEFETLYGCAEAPLKPILLMAFDTGMRKREILDLRWEQVNLKAGTVRLAARDTKSKQPRVIILTGRVREVLEKLPRSISGYVFVNPDTDKPWNQIVKVFHRARKSAGLTKLWFHDLRRSFITNARRRGVAESVVMRMSGHRTRSVFERYNVVSEEDLREAARVIEIGSRREADEAKKVSVT